VSKPLPSKYDLTPMGARLARAEGYAAVDPWTTRAANQPCDDCGRPTTWRDAKERPRHPYTCGEAYERYLSRKADNRARRGGSW
jgi:hypothetical protein